MDQTKTKQSLSQKIKVALKELLGYLSENKVIFICSFIAFIFACLKIYDVGYTYKNNAHNIPNLLMHIAYGFTMAVFFAIPATLISKRFSVLKKYLIQIIAAAAGLLLGFFSIRYGFGNKVYCSLYYFGITAAVVSVTIFIFIPKENQRTYYAGLVKYFLFSCLMSFVLFAGICLLIYAFQNLIFNTEEDELYECCFAFAGLVFFFNSFIFYLFNRRQEETSGKAFKVIVLYILLPVFTVLIAVLYAYLFKALILRKLPNGQINWFVSFASCFYIVFYFILREYDQLPVIKFFYRFGAFAFIPLICIQIPAYIIRVNAYGFTGWRYSSLLFIIFSIITIALTFIKKGKFTRYSILVLTAIIIIDSLTPINLINVAHKNQFSRMVKVLKKNNMYDTENKTLSNYDREKADSQISDEDRHSLYSSFCYLYYTSSLPKPEWMKIDDNVGYRERFENIFGIKKEKTDESITDLEWNSPDTSFDISGYSKMISIYENESSYGKIGDTWDNYAKEIPAVIHEYQSQSYDLTQLFLSLEKNKLQKSPLWYSPDDKVSFCFTKISYDYNADRKLFKNYSYSGYMFIK